MGGTGGPGSDRSAAQTGLQGAGLLAGSGTEAESSKKAALGIVDAPQPTSGMLAGTEGAIVAPPGPTSASDTPKDVTPVTPAVAAPNTTAFSAPSTSTVTPPALPTAPTFTLAGTSNLGFPSGVTDDNPFGTTTHVPFGTKEVPAITGPAITGPAIAAAAPAAADTTTGWHQLWPNANVSDRGWLAAHPNWTDEQDRSVQHADGTWWAPDDTSLPLTGMKFYGSDTPVTAADLWAQAVAGNNPIAKWDKVGTKIK